MKRRLLPRKISLPKTPVKKPEVNLPFQQKRHKSKSNLPAKLIQKTPQRPTAKQIETQAIEHAEKFLVRRWGRLLNVRRQVITWGLIMAGMLSLVWLQILFANRAYIISAPARGDTYFEAVAGKLSTLNPLFIETEAEKAASRLLFSSLYYYDSTGNLKGDLAKSLSISEDGKTYGITLHENIKWHDDVNLTAADIEYTIGLLANASLNLPQRQIWQGIKIKTNSKYSLEFSLPNAYAPFRHALTFPILPKHLLSEIEPAELADAQFNQLPVGSGPFKFKQIRLVNLGDDTTKTVINFEANQNYHHPVGLDRYELAIFETDDQLIQALKSGEANAAANLKSAQMLNLAQNQPQFNLQTNPTFSGAFAFFNHDKELFQKLEFRQALRLAVDVNKLRRAVNQTEQFSQLKEVDSSVAQHEKLDYPIIPNQISKPTLAEPPKHNREEATKLLTGLGLKFLDNKWLNGSDGKPIKLKVASLSDGDLAIASKNLASQLEDFGFEVELNQTIDSDNSLQFVQNTVKPRNYDILVYNIDMGGDPDVFAFWHSSQKGGNGLNLSNYGSVLSDDLLLTARSTTDLKLRQAKYKSFIENWLNDAPAIGLYRGQFNYVTLSNSTAHSKTTVLVTPADRYANVYDWTADTKLVYKTP